MRAVPGINPRKILDREGPSAPLQGRAFLLCERSCTQFVSQEAISAIRMKAELARRLSGETRDPAAKAGLLELAALLDADADTLENAALEPPPEALRDE